MIGKVQMGYDEEELLKEQEFRKQKFNVKVLLMIACKDCIRYF